MGSMGLSGQKKLRLVWIITENYRNFENNLCLEKTYLKA